MNRWNVLCEIKSVGKINAFVNFLQRDFLINFSNETQKGKGIEKKNRVKLQTAM